MDHKNHPPAALAWGLGAAFSFRGFYHTGYPSRQAPPKTTAVSGRGTE
ncbi:MAG: hypothetical protein NT140_01105 [Deltaproteobacteria bacterium]|nr:hypothetical protein [Deltaproteobacteria bacterium]